MKRAVSLIFGLILIANMVFSQNRYPIVPYPNKLIATEGEFRFKGILKVVAGKTFKSELETLKPIFEEEYFTQLISSKSGSLVVVKNETLTKEAYKLIVTREKIRIEASAGAGYYYAFQTIRQLMKLNGDGSYSIPACTIEDQPAFAWRSFLLDEGRFFQGAKVVKSLLDQMAYMKMNVFHWHLTDDQGWRIEIKKYPLLTSVGGWRDSTCLRRSYLVGTNPDILTAWKNEDTMVPEAGGGYYTQAEIREIVAYAAKRHITIVPEIDVPGHITAAIVAYPWLTAIAAPQKVPAKWGIYQYALNVTDDRVNTFVKDVFTEVMDLFPGKVIHIGGDEVKYDSWKDNPEIKQYMQNNGLKTFADLHIDFTNRLSVFLQQHGRSLMGWNEIMGNVHVEKGSQNAQSKLAKNSVIQFWKGNEQQFTEILDQGYDMVNSDRYFTYFDWGIERTPLDKIYHFSVIPKGLSAQQAKHIIGVGGEMWGEITPTVIAVNQRTFPRIAAIAELGWTLEENKDYSRFSIALMNLKKYWLKNGILFLE
jgi:hexosaminidase